jgi:hypothetical protein
VKQQLTPSGIVILVAAGVMLLASFLAFWEIDLPGLPEISYSAWSTDLFFPVTIIPVVCGLVMAAHVALTGFANVMVPVRILGFTWNQLHLVLGLHAALMMLAFLVQDTPVDKGIGFYLMLLSGLGLAIGGVLRNNETRTSY